MRLEACGNDFDEKHIVKVKTFCTYEQKYRKK